MAFDSVSSSGIFPSQSVQDSSLEAMLKTMHADLPTLHPDISILEEKDFDYVRGGDFRVTPDAEPSVRQGLQILWNSGNMIRVSLLRHSHVDPSAESGTSIREFPDSAFR
jgi:hypothetical protein